MTVPVIVREEPAPCRIKLNIEIPQAKVAELYDAVEREFVRQAQVPGFRHGKAPRSLLRRHYGPRINDTVMDRLLRWGTGEALRQENLEPETVPRIENEDNLQVRPDAGLVYTVSFDVAPAFELPDYKHIAIRQEAVEVSDDQVEQVIMEVLRSRTSYDKVDRPAQPEDLLKASYHSQLEDAELPESARYLLQADETWIALREPEIFPGVTEKLSGGEAGETRQITVSFPEDFYEEALRGKTVEYTVHIDEVHAASTPEFTDDVARQFGADSADQARERIRQSLVARGQEHRQEALRNQLLKQLLDQLDFPLPPAMVARETYQVLLRLYQREVQQRTSEESLNERRDQLRHQAEKIARSHLKRHYLLRRIAAAENIQVERHELNDMLQYLSRVNHVSPKVMQRRLEDNNQLGDLADHILESKTISRLMALADIQPAAAPAPQ